LRSDGSVVTWGNSCQDAADSSAVAAKLDGTVDATQIFSTATAFAALRSDGSVVTWGYSSYGGNSSAVASQLASGIVSFANIDTNDVFIDFIGNDAPMGTDTSLSAAEDSVYTLKAADFGFMDFNDVPANTLLAVKITTLPTAGALKLNGVAVTAGQVVTAVDIAANKLVYAPATNANGTAYARFTFQVKDNGGTANGGVDLDPTPNSLTFNVTPVNDAPTVANAIADRATNEDAAFSYTVPANTFADVDVGDSLSYAARPLPSWLRFDAATRTFSGTPLNGDVGALDVQVTATDRFGGSVADNFRLTVNNINDAPTGTDKTVTLLEDGSYTVTAADFGFADASDNPANSLLAVKITTLPGAGSLKLNNVAVAAGQVVTAANIAAGLLKFAPAANANGANYANLTFQVQDNGGTANGGVDLDPTPNTLTFNVTAVNDAPTGTDKTLTLLEDGSVTLAAADFGFADATDSPANSLLAVKITTLPTAGTLKLNNVAVTAGQVVTAADIAAGLLKFAPAANANGTAYANLKFQVQDNGGTANGGVDLDATPNTLAFNVTALNDAPTGSVSLSGTARQGQTLTASHALADIDGLGTVTYTWKTGATVLGTGSSYLLKATDVGKTVTVTASYTDGGGTAESQTSAASAIVGAAHGGSAIVTITQNTQSSPGHTLGEWRNFYAFAVIKADGSVVTWGYSNFGGDSSAVAAKLDGAVDVTQIFSTEKAFAALRSDGSVVTWGDSSYGGDSRLVAAKLDGTVDVTQIFSTAYAFAALRSDGSVVTWGYSDGGGNSSAVAAQLDGTVDVTQIFSTGSAFAALRSDGSVVTWGGSGGNSSAVAAQLDGTVDVTQIFSTHGAFAALRSDGSVVTWGDSFYGGNSSAVASQLLSGVISGANIDTDDWLSRTVANDAPAGADKTVTLLEDGSYTVAAADFGFTDFYDDPANALLAVKITTLPTVGALKLNGVAVSAGQTISAADIAANKLVFTPAANGNGVAYANLKFQVQDNGGTANGGVDLDPSPNTLTFNVTAVNDAPTLANAIADRTANEDAAFSYTVPANSFADIDVGDSLSYSVSRADGSALPSWLAFNTATRQFSGTPGYDDVGKLDIKVTASDNSGDSASDVFSLNISPRIGTTLTVSNLNDSGAGSLREALALAQSRDTITFAAGLSGGVIRLNSTLLINEHVRIDADINNDHRPDITLSGDANGNGVTDEGDVRIINIGNNQHVDIQGLIFTHGYLKGASSEFGDGGDAQGAAIFNAGILRVVDSKFVSNVAIGGNGGDGYDGYAPSSGYIVGRVYYGGGIYLTSYRGGAGGGGGGAGGDAGDAVAAIYNQNALSLTSVDFADNQNTVGLAGKGGNGGGGGRGGAPGQPGQSSSGRGGAPGMDGERGQNGWSGVLSDGRPVPGLSGGGGGGGGGGLAGVSGDIGGTAWTVNTPLDLSAPEATVQAVIGDTFALGLGLTGVDSGESLTWATSGLPSWLSFDPASYRLAGTPSTSGRGTLRLHVEDGRGG
ncbi:MAG: putative Ig domain-containing protein, partial [Candidatus Methylumidiphilus sp.]